MSNLRAGAYLCLLLSVGFLIIPFVAGQGDGMLRLVFLFLAVILGAIGITLNSITKKRKKKVRTLFLSVCN